MQVRRVKANFTKILRAIALKPEREAEEILFM